MKKAVTTGLLCLILAFLYIPNTYAQYNPNITDAHRYELHFSHPLNEESISPDSHGRLDYLFTNIGNQTTQNTLNFEFEYALSPAFSISASLPYQIISQNNMSTFSHTDNLEISLKFANYTLAVHHFLLGYGSSFELPTGSSGKGIGSSTEFGIDPYFDMGYMYRKWQWTAFATFGIPTHLQKSICQCSNEFNLQFATVYQALPSLQGIFEMQRISQLNGPNTGQSSFYLTEGIKYLIPNSPIMAGVGIREPLSRYKEFKTQALVSIFYDL